MDILDLLHTGKLTLEEVDQIVDRELREGGHWWLRLGVNRYEITAYANIPDWEMICSLRYNGWPTICSRCGKSFDYHEFGWTIKGFDVNEKPMFTHIGCKPSKD